jgi:ABC-type spermidine/putrescine transport system permease subunit I
MQPTLDAYKLRKSDRYLRKPPMIRQRLWAAVPYFIGSLIFILLICIMQNRDLTHKLEDQKAVTMKYSKHLADVFNGQTLYDKANGVAYFFEKPIEVKL